MGACIRELHSALIKSSHRLALRIVNQLWRIKVSFPFTYNLRIHQIVGSRILIELGQGPSTEASIFHPGLSSNLAQTSPTRGMSLIPTAPGSLRGASAHPLVLELLSSVRSMQACQCQTLRHFAQCSTVVGMGLYYYDQDKNNNNTLN